jgi:hypothetical protein
LFACPSSWLRRANCVQRRKEEAKMTQRRGPFLRACDFLSTGNFGSLKAVSRLGLLADEIDWLLGI